MTKFEDSELSKCQYFGGICMVFTGRVHILNVTSILMEAQTDIQKLKVLLRLRWDSRSFQDGCIAPFVKFQNVQMHPCYIVVNNLVNFFCFLKFFSSTNLLKSEQSGIDWMFANKKSSLTPYLILISHVRGHVSVKTDFWTFFKHSAFFIFISYSWTSILCLSIEVCNSS